MFVPRAGVAELSRYPPRLQEPHRGTGAKVPHANLRTLRLMPFVVAPSIPNSRSHRHCLFDAGFLFDFLQNMMAHIRYATQGEVSMENVHPFSRVWKGVQMSFCHVSAHRSTVHFGSPKRSLNFQLQLRRGLFRMENVPNSPASPRTIYPSWERPRWPMWSTIPWVTPTRRLSSAPS